jgi:hypothetical protein
MKAPAPDTEPLRDKQSAQVRASHRFPYAQPTNFAYVDAVMSRFGKPLVASAVSTAAGALVSAVCVDSGYESYRDCRRAN